MYSKKSAYILTIYLSQSLMFLIFLEMLRLFFSAVFFINLVEVELNVVSFFFLLAFFLPAVVYFISFDVLYGFTILGSLAFIVRLVLNFKLAPMMKIVFSSIGVGILLIWLLSELLHSDLERRTVFAHSFLIALLLDLGLRAAGNSIDASAFPAVGTIISLIGVSSILVYFILSKNHVEFKESNSLEKIASKQHATYSSFQVSFLLLGLIFLYSIALLVPNALSRWSNDLVEKANYWIITGLEVIIIAFLLSFYKNITNAFLKLSRYWRMGLFILLEVVLIPMLLLNGIGYSYLAILALPISLLFLIPELNFNIIDPRHKKKLVSAFTISSFIILLLFLINIFAFNYAYVPAGDIFKALNNWTILIPLIIAAFLVMETKAKVTLKPSSQISKIMRYTMVGSIIVIVLTSGIVYTQIHPETVSPDEFKIITYNIQQGYSNDGSFNYLGVYETLRDSGADIIGLQETETSRVTSLDMSIVQWLAWKLNMYAYEGPALNDLCYGIALLSRYPITSVDLELMPSRGEQTAFISAMIVLGGIMINVIVTHFGEYLDDRTAQAVAIYHYVEKSTSSRSILVGDFNTEYGEEPYNITTSIYLDAWLQVFPSGFNETGFSGNTSGDHRIDMIFYYGLTCTAIEVLTFSTASDHKPVLATFSVE